MLGQVANACPYVIIMETSERGNENEKGNKDNR